MRAVFCAISRSNNRHELGVQVGVCIRADWRVWTIDVSPSRKVADGGFILSDTESFRLDVAVKDIPEPLRRIRTLVNQKRYRIQIHTVQHMIKEGFDMTVVGNPKSLSNHTDGAIFRKKSANRTCESQTDIHLQRSIRYAAPLVRRFERQSVHRGSHAAEAREQKGPEVHLLGFCTAADNQE